LHTLGDLARAEGRWLENVLGAWGLEAQALARGIDPRNVVPDQLAKSIGAEDTFDHDIRGREGLERRLLAQASRVAQRLCHERLLGRVVVVKVKYADFSIQTRRTTLIEAVGDTDSIFAVVRSLLDRIDLSRPIRLTGVSLADLRTESTAATLFEEPVRARRRRLEQVSAKIADRFGAGRIRRAALLEKE